MKIPITAETNEFACICCREYIHLPLRYGQTVDIISYSGRGKQLAVIVRPHGTDREFTVFPDDLYWHRKDC